MESKPFGEAPLLPLAVSMMVGIVIGWYVQMPFPLWPVLAGGVVIALLLRRWAMWQSVAIVVSFVVLGALLMQMERAEVSEAERSMTRVERSRHWFLEQRAQLLKRLETHGVEGEAYSVVAAMALGDKSTLTKDLRDTYAATGASHVLALSGLHLGIIYTLLSLVLARRRWQVLSQLLILTAVWAFVFLVGMTVSVVRAAVMLSVYAMLSLGRRDRMSVNTLAFTAMVMLAFEPSWLFDIGFQLSFVAVFFILLFLPLLENAGWVWTMTVVSCAAQLGTAPLVAYYFGRISPWFLLTNFVVVPAATLIVWLSLVVLVVPSLAPMLAWVATTLNRLLGMIAVLPGASVSGLHPSLLQVAMLYVAILSTYLLIFRRKGW